MAVAKQVDQEEVAPKEADQKEVAHPPSKVIDFWGGATFQKKIAFGLKDLFYFVCTPTWPGPSRLQAHLPLQR